MTATQPAIFESSALQNLHPPLRELSPGAFNRYDLYVQITEELTTEDLAERVRAVVAEADGPSCLVIVNTIREALDLFSLVQSVAPLAPQSVFHLSTNLRPKDRKRILEEIGKCQGTPHVLISTQVVEAGVDLSFDVVFRALAPLDAVVQAAGRCNRHGVGRRGRVFLVNTRDRTGHLIYGNTLMGAAQDALKKVAAEGAILPEPKLQDCVTDYFRFVAGRTENDTHRKIMEAVQMWEFAFLRGEGIEEPKDHAKEVRLIDDRGDTVPHYIELDASDASVWGQFRDAVALSDLNQRRRSLRQLWPEVGQRIVEVPKTFADRVEEDTGIVYVSQAVAPQYYDARTGWRRMRV
jgi:CRISPR-associated endonuclease/helicase Cas3